MSVYHFEQDSPVSEIVMRRSAAGGMRIFLFASSTLNQQQIGRLKDTLDKEGLQYVASESDNKPCLQVHGVTNIKQLESILRKGGFISGAHTLTHGDNITYSFKEKFNNRMLFVTGALCMLADAGILLYGYLKQKLERHSKPWEDMAASIAYTSGSMMLTFFGGGDKSSHYIQDVCTKLQEKMQSDGVSTAPGSALASFTTHQEQSALKRVHHFLSRHPSEMYNALTATAGGFMAFGARKSDDKTTRITDSVLGVSTFLAGSTAALVKEKPTQANDPAAHTWFSKTKHWVQNRPNRVAGIGYLIASAAHGVETVQNLWRANTKYGNSIIVKPGDWTHGWKQKNLAYLTYSMRAMFFVPNLLAEVILALSSKSNGGGHTNDSIVENTAYAIVADTISQQSPAERKRLIHEYSYNFLARPDVLGGNAAKIEVTLSERMKHLLNNHWSSQLKPAAAPAYTEGKKWQEKIISNTAEPSLAAG